MYKILLGELLGEKEKLISGRTETTGINLIDSQDLRWISTSLLHSRQCSTTLNGKQEESVAEYARQVPRGHWSFLVPGYEKKWYVSYDGIPSGHWTQTGEKMLLNFEKSGHPKFRCN